MNIYEARVFTEMTNHVLKKNQPIERFHSVNFVPLKWPLLSENVYICVITTVDQTDQSQFHAREPYTWPRDNTQNTRTIDASGMGGGSLGENTLRSDIGTMVGYNKTR